jgi:hypothetical protein
VYTRRTQSGRLVLGVYVDDLIITGTTSKAIIVFKTLSLLSYYLGIKFRLSEDGIFLCQKAYTGNLLERCGLGICNPTASPMES